VLLNKKPFCVREGFYKVFRLNNIYYTLPFQAIQQQQHMVLEVLFAKVGLLEFIVLKCYAKV
jgi:hypothetical protein